MKKHKTNCANQNPLAPIIWFADNERCPCCGEGKDVPSEEIYLKVSRSGTSIFSTMALLYSVVRNNEPLIKNKLYNMSRKDRVSVYRSVFEKSGWRLTWGKFAKGAGLKEYHLPKVIGWLEKENLVVNKRNNMMEWVGEKS